MKATSWVALPNPRVHPRHVPRGLGRPPSPPRPRTPWLGPIQDSARATSHVGSPLSRVRSRPIGALSGGCRRSLASAWPSRARPERAGLVVGCEAERGSGWWLGALSAWPSFNRASPSSARASPRRSIPETGSMSPSSLPGSRRADSAASLASPSAKATRARRSGPPATRWRSRMERRMRSADWRSPARSYAAASATWLGMRLGASRTAASAASTVPRVRALTVSIHTEPGTAARAASTSSGGALRSCEINSVARRTAYQTSSLRGQSRSQLSLSARKRFASVPGGGGSFANEGPSTDHEKSSCLPRVGQPCPGVFPASGESSAKSTESRGRRIMAVRSWRIPSPRGEFQCPGSAPSSWCLDRSAECGYTRATGPGKMHDHERSHTHPPAWCGCNRAFRCHCVGG
jgi:hypothetical protein